MYILLAYNYDYNICYYKVYTYLFSKFIYVVLGNIFSYKV